MVGYRCQTLLKKSFESRQLLSPRGGIERHVIPGNLDRLWLQTLEPETSIISGCRTHQNRWFGILVDAIVTIKGSSI